MWVIGTNNLENGEADSSIYRGAADGTVWESIEGEGVRIAAGPEYLWVVNSKGEIFRQPWRAAGFHRRGFQEIAAWDCSGAPSLAQDGQAPAPLQPRFADFSGIGHALLTQLLVKIVA